MTATDPKPPEQKPVRARRKAAAVAVLPDAAAPTAPAAASSIATRDPASVAAPAFVPPAAPPRRPSTISVTVATQRSGTKVLGACLNAGVRAKSLGEVFHSSASAMVSLAGFLRRYPDLGQEIALGRTWDLLDRYTLELSQLAPYVHFDVMYNNLNFLAPLWHQDPVGFPMLGYLRSRNVAIVHLVRDPLETYVSGIVAEFTDVYHKVGDRASKVFTPDQGKLETLVARRPFEAYRNDVRAFRDRVRNQLQGYPFALELDYHEILGKDGILRADTRTRLAALLLNGEDPRWLQVLPSPLTRPDVPTSLYDQVRAVVGPIS